MLEVIQNALHPDVKAHYICDNTAVVHNTKQQTKFNTVPNLNQILLAFWDNCLKNAITESSIVVFDQNEKILCNGLFSFVNRSNIHNVYYWKADYNMHLIINDTRSSNIQFSIEIDNHYYTGDFDLNVTNKPNISDWFKYICGLRPLLFKAVCFGILYGIYQIPAHIFKDRFFTVTIHHINTKTYQWKYAHRSVLSEKESFGF